MKRRAVLAILIFCAVFSAGCGVVISEAISAIQDAGVERLPEDFKIEEGKTTQEEIRKVFGPPDTIVYGTYPQWIYRRLGHISLVGLRSTKHQNLIVVFDGDGVVTQYFLISQKG